MQRPGHELRGNKNICGSRRVISLDDAGAVGAVKPQTRHLVVGWRRAISVRNIESVPVAIATGNEEAAASEHSADKRRLLDEYHSATAGVLTTLDAAERTDRTSSREQYEALRRAVDVEPVNSEQARLV